MLVAAALQGKQRELHLMINTLGLRPSLGLHTSLSPRLQRAVRLLQMSSLDFSQALRDVLETNPFLEGEDAFPESEVDTAGSAEEGDDGESGAAAELSAWGSDPLGRSRADGEDAVFDTLVAPTSLADHLLGQLKVLPLPPRDLALAATLAGSLDDDGYLRCPLDEIGAAADLDPPAEPDELLIALRRVQALDPAGVGARELVECLQLQLPQIESTELRDVAREMLQNHLQALAARELNTLARRLGLPRATVEAACAAIRRLDPRPGWRYGQAPVQYITPDVIVRRRRGQWIATLNPAVIPRVRLNQSYAELFSRCRQAEHSELSTQLQEARWTVRNVEQRFSTILSVSRAILKRQHRFLVYGPMAMRPLALREIADEVGVHESTVSRVTNNKFMATPCGVFELKYFFSRGLATASGGECSPTAIRGLIQELIAAEPPAQPLSDVDLARQLAVQGLQVARRTVTKYRQQLKIEPAQRRTPSISAREMR
jgi:RNA polymerase sigma-54 factor